MSKKQFEWTIDLPSQVRVRISPELALAIDHAVSRSIESGKLEDDECVCVTIDSSTVDIFLEGNRREEIVAAVRGMRGLPDSDGRPAVDDAAAGSAELDKSRRGEG